MPGGARVQGGDLLPFAGGGLSALIQRPVVYPSQNLSASKSLRTSNTAVMCYPALDGTILALFIAFIGQLLTTMNTHPTAARCTGVTDLYRYFSKKAGSVSPSFAGGNAAIASLRAFAARASCFAILSAMIAVITVAPAASISAA